MKTRIAVAVGIAIVLGLFAGGASAGKRSAFEGAWESYDIMDGSRQWMWITDFAGVYEILIYDGYCSTCPEVDDRGVVPPVLVVGSGQVDDETGELVLDNGVLWCYWPDGAEMCWAGYGDTYAYAHKVILDDWGNRWVPSEDERPAKVITGKLLRQP